MSNLKGRGLDWEVAKYEGVALEVSRDNELVFEARDPKYASLVNDYNSCRWQVYAPSTDWAQGGPIIEREKIDLTYEDGLGWGAYAFGCASDKDMEYGPTPLIAAMRCYIASKESK